MPLQGVDLMKAANTRLISGNFAQAQKHLLQCIKLYPNFTEPYMSLVAVFQEQGQWLKALHVYAMALHMKPSDGTIALECAKLSAGSVPLGKLLRLQMMLFLAFQIGTVYLSGLAASAKLCHLTVPHVPFFQSIQLCMSFSISMPVF
jgi:tetratricopeptide (TPR) repeat protein